MSEVRDRVAREKLDRFPFEIKLRRPSKEAIEIGSDSFYISKE